MSEDPASAQHAPIPPPPPPPPPPPYPAGYASPYAPAAYYPPGYLPGYPYAMPRNSGRAIAVLVLGITSLVMLCGYGIGVIPAIVGLCLAPGARREIEFSGGRITGDGLLKAGVICSWISLALTVVGVIAFIALLVLGATIFPSDPSVATP